MPLFVHIAAENVARRIARSGIAPTRLGRTSSPGPAPDRAVWAFPVLPSHTLTHSWSRELKRWGRTTLAAVTFRLEDDEPVYARHFREAPLLLTAAEAVGVIAAAPDPRGYEILVPRRIRASEIRRIRILARPVGWRYFPTAKGKPPWLCDCPVCLPRGEVNARRDRERVRRRIAERGKPQTQA